MCKNRKAPVGTKYQPPIIQKWLRVRLGTTTRYPKQIFLFGRYVTKRLDQNTQNWESQINTSPRLKLLGKLKGHTYCQSGYLKEIKDIEARQTFTRLRLNMHVLATSKCRKNTNGDNSEQWPLCKTESESVEHFLLRCPKISDSKQNFINGIVHFEPNFDRMNNDEKLKTMLNLECKPETRHLVIEFVTNTYKQRRSLTG